MSYIEEIKNKNPMVFNMFKNIYENKKLVHSYLFSAPGGTSIHNEPLFLIELLISSDPFAGKIRKVNSYPDLQIINNEKQIIKKAQIINAVRSLQETAFEKNGKKFLLINNLEFANAQALNSLLKFLEDPTPNTYLIFTTNNLSKILKTIQSRMQLLVY